MKVIVAGSRGITDEAIVLEALKQAYLFEGINPTCIVSGAARGVDTVGEKIARRHGLKIDRRPAKWATLGRAAGLLRNVEMAESADALVAVWDGKSPGTKHMIRVATEKGLLVWVLRTDL